MTPGYRKTPEYQTWNSMRQRCLNPRHKRYTDYGGRGITICERWQDFETFLADMGPRPSRRHTLDRLDHDRGYTPENCRWATPKEQQRQTRASRLLSFQGITLPLRAWAEKFGIAPHILSQRLAKGWPMERALMTASQLADAARQMSVHPCACGCRASVKPGQRWSQPACKARAYRARQRAARDQERQEFWDGVEKYVQLEEDYDGLEEAYDRLKADYSRLEEAFHTFREQHQQCRRLPSAEAAPRPWFGDAYAVLGVRPDAELEAIHGAYRALAQKYHSDRHPGEPAMEARIGVHTTFVQKLSLTYYTPNCPGDSPILLCV